MNATGAVVARKQSESSREKIGGLWPLPARRRIEGMQGQVLLPARQAKGHSKTLQGGSLGH
jgi:hypothetical protein